MPDGDHVFCLIDDRILANESKEMHHKTIEVLLHICTQYRLTLKLGKCATHWLRLHRISRKQGGATGWCLGWGEMILTCCCTSQLNLFLKILGGGQLLGVTPGCGFAWKHVVRTSHVIKIASRKSVCKYDLTINELSFSCAMGFVRTFMSHYSQVLQILERFNGDLTRREVQANTYAMAKINSSWLSSRSSASFCVQLRHRPRAALAQCSL